MNCYQKVLAKMALNGDMQDNGADMAYLLLSSLAAAGYVDSDVLADPFAETLRRLQAWKGFGLRRLAHLFADYTTVSGDATQTY